MRVTFPSGGIRPFVKGCSRAAGDSPGGQFDDGDSRLRLMQGLHWQHVLSQGSRATPERREIGGSWVRPNLEALCVLLTLKVQVSHMQRKPAQLSSPQKGIRANRWVSAGRD